MNFVDTISKLKEEKISFIVATLVEVIGSAPQEIGAKIIITENGLYSGTIGGGKIELKVIDVAKKLLKSDQNFIYEKYNLQKDIGMTCGGVVGISFEAYREKPNLTLAIFGAGHVSQELIKLLSRLKFNLLCVDPRKDWLDRIDSKIDIKKIQTENMANVIDDLNDNAFIISLTMGHAFDRPILAAALKRNFPFVGVIGSDKKKNTLIKELKEMDNLNDVQIEKLICPVGEDFGNNEPVEIAFSIVAQILKKRDELVKLS